MVLRPVRPGVPVAHEHPVIDLAGGGIVRHGLRPVDRAGQVGAVREDGQRHRHPGGVRAEAIGVHVQRQIGHLLRAGPVGGGAPDLAGTRTAREEIQPAVRAPAGGIGAALIDSQPDRLARRVQVHHEQGARAPVGGDVGRGHRIDHPAAVRRHLRITQPVQGDHVLPGEGVELRRGGGRGPGGPHPRRFGQGGQGGGPQQGGGAQAGEQTGQRAHAGFLEQGAKVSMRRGSTGLAPGKDRGPACRLRRPS